MVSKSDNPAKWSWIPSFIVGLGVAFAPEILINTTTIAAEAVETEHEPLDLLTDSFLTATLLRIIPTFQEE